MTKVGPTPGFEDDPPSAGWVVRYGWEDTYSTFKAAKDAARDQASQRPGHKVRVYEATHEYEVIVEAPKETKLQD